MGTNIVLKHLTISNSNTQVSTTTNAPRTVTIQDIGTTNEKASKKVDPVQIPTTKNNWATVTDLLTEKPIKLIDLLRIGRTWSIKGIIEGDNTGSWTNSRTTLNESLTAGDTTITVTAAANLEHASQYKPGFIQIDNEIIKYTGKSTNDLTDCIRGCYGTTAAAHTNGSNIYHPAIHVKKQLIYIFEAGGCFKMSIGKSSIEDTLGDVTLDTTTSDVYDVNITAYTITERAEDQLITLQYDVTLELSQGINL